jgi:hypothetical protein
VFPVQEKDRPESNVLLDLPWNQIFLLEDNAARATRRPPAGVRSRNSREIVVGLHKITSEGVQLVGEEKYAPGTLSEVYPRGGRVALARELLDSARAIPTGSIIVAGPRYGCNAAFVRGDLGNIAAGDRHQCSSRIKLSSGAPMEMVYGLHANHSVR